MQEGFIDLGGTPPPEEQQPIPVLKYARMPQPEAEPDPLQQQVPQAEEPKFEMPGYELSSPFMEEVRANTQDFRREVGEARAEVPNLMNIPPTAPGVEKRAAAKKMMWAYTGGMIDSANGSEFNPDGVGLSDDEYYETAKKVVREGFESIKRTDLLEWEAIPNEDRKARANHAREKLDWWQTTKFKIGEAANWAASTETQGLLTDAELASAPDDVQKANAYLRELVDKQAEFQRGGPDTNLPYSRERAAIPDMKDSPEFKLINDWKQKSEDERAINAYETHLSTRYAWRTILAVKPFLSKEGMKVLDSLTRDEEWKQENWVGLGSDSDNVWRFKNLLTPKDQRLIASVAGTIKDRRDKAVFRDMGLAALDMARRIPEQFAEKVLIDRFVQSRVDNDTYQRIAETEATLASTVAPRLADYGYFKQALIGTAATIPYMAYARLGLGGKFGLTMRGPGKFGLAMIAGQAAKDFETRVAAAGGKVSGAEFQLVTVGAGLAYALVEHLQANRLLKPMTDIERRTAFAQFWGQFIIPGRWISKDAWKSWAYNAPKVLGQGAKDTLFELIEETPLQKSIEEAVVAWGLDQPIARAVAEGSWQELKDAFGVMVGVSFLGGAGRGAVSNLDRKLLPNQVQEMMALQPDLRQAMRTGDKKAQERIMSTVKGLIRLHRNAGGGKEAVRRYVQLGLDPNSALDLSNFFDEQAAAIIDDPDIKQSDKDRILGKEASLKEIIDQVGMNDRVTPNADGTYTVRGQIDGVPTEYHVVYVPPGSIPVDLNNDSIAQQVSDYLLNPKNNVPQEWRLTKDQFLALDQEQKKTIFDKTSLRTPGNWKRTGPNVAGAAEVQGTITLEQGANRTFFHEYAHPFMEFLSANNLLTEQEKQKYQQEFGPAAGLDFNEEQAADYFRDVMVRGVDFLHRNALEKALGFVPDAVFRRRIRAKARTVAEHLRNEILEGRHSPMPIGLPTSKRYYVTQQADRLGLPVPAESQPPPNAPPAHGPGAPAPESPDPNTWEMHGASGDVVVMRVQDLISMANADYRASLMDGAPDINGLEARAAIEAAVRESQDGRGNRKPILSRRNAGMIVVDTAGNVVYGNHNVIALQRILQDGGFWAEQKQAVEEAARRGIVVPDGMQNWVLVRRVTSVQDDAGIGELAKKFREGGKRFSVESALSTILGTAPSGMEVADVLAKYADDLGLAHVAEGLSQAADAVVAIDRDRPDLGLKLDVGIAVRVLLESNLNNRTVDQSNWALGLKLPQTSIRLSKALEMMPNARSVASLLQNYAWMARAELPASVADLSAWNAAKDVALAKAVAYAKLDAAEARYSVESSDVDALGFYSPTERAVAAMTLKQAIPAADMIHKLAGLQGAKKQEVVESELDAWLFAESAAGRKVTKEQVLGFLRQNGVRYKLLQRGSEIVKAQNAERDRLDKEIAKASKTAFKKLGKNESWGEYEINHDTSVIPATVRGLAHGKILGVKDMSEAFDGLQISEKRRAALLEYTRLVHQKLDMGHDNDAAESKYDDYMPNGGRNYREYLFQVANRQPTITGERGQFFDTVNIENYESLPEDARAVLDRHKDPDDSNMIAELQDLGYIVDTDMDGTVTGILKPAEATGKPVFRGDHWSEGDIFAHALVDNRSINVTDKAVAEMLPAGVDREAFSYAGLHAVEMQSDMIQSGFEQAKFKKDAWKRLTLRTLLKMAVDGGFSFLTWSTGADRFAKWGSQRIEWTKTRATVVATENGKFRVIDENGKPIDFGVERKVDFDTREEAKERSYAYPIGWKVAGQEQVAGEHQGQNLEELAAQRGVLLQTRGRVVTTKAELRDALQKIHREHISEDDKIVTRVWERMQTEPEGTLLPRKDFFEFLYDKSFVQEANDIVRKMDPEAKVVEVQAWMGNPTWRITPNDGTASRTTVSKSIAEQARKDGDTVVLESGGNQAVHAVPITQKIKDAVAQGQPRFSVESGDNVRVLKHDIGNANAGDTVTLTGNRAGFEDTSADEQPRHSLEGRLMPYGTDASVVADLAIQILAGQDPNVEDAKKIIFNHMAAGLDPQQALDQAQNLAQGEKGSAAKQALRSGQVRAAIDMLGREAERDAADDANLAAIVAEAGVDTGLERGIRIGQGVASARDRAMKIRIRDARGMTLCEFDAYTGVDMAETLLGVQPVEFAGGKPTGIPRENQTQKPGGFDDLLGEAPVGPPAPVPAATPAEIAARDDKIRALIEEAKAQAEFERMARAERDRRRAEKARQEKDKPENDEEDAKEPGEPEAFAIPANLLEKHAVNLNMADETAAFLRLLIEDWIIGTSDGRLNRRNVWEDPAAVEKYRKTVVEQLEHLSRSMIDPTDFSPVLIQKLIDSFATNMTVEQIEKRSQAVISLIQRNAVRQSRNKLIDEMRSQIKEKVEMPGELDQLADDLKSKVTRAVRDAAMYIRKVVRLGPVGVEREFQRMDDIIQNQQQDYQNTALDLESDLAFRSALLKRQLLEKYGGLKQKLPAEIIAAQVEINKWLDEEQQKLRDRWFNEMENQARILNELIRAMTPEVEGRPVEDLDRDTLHQFGQQSLATITQKLNYLIRHGNPAQRTAGLHAIEELSVLLHQGSTRYINTIQAYRTAWKEAIYRAVGARGKFSPAAARYAKRLDEPMPESVTTQVSKTRATGKNRMTWGQGIQLYVSITQKSLADNVAAHGRTGQAAILEGAFTSEDLVFIAELRDIYEKRLAELSQAVEAVTGMPVRRPDALFMPVKMETDPREGAGTDKAVKTFKALADSLTPRRRNGLDFDESVSIEDIYNSRAEDTARAIAYGRAGLFLTGILANPAFAKVAKRYYGQKPLTDLHRHLVKTLSGSTKSDGVHGKIAAAIRKWTSYLSMSYNLSPATKQFTSWPVYMAVMEDGWEGLGRAVFNWNKADLLEVLRSDDFKARYGAYGFIPEIVETMSDLKSGFVEKLYSAGMSVLQVGDFLPSAIMLPGLYRSRLDALMAKPGAVEAQARKDAMSWAWMKLEQTQQSGRMENRPLLYQGDSHIAMLFMQYASDSLLKWSHEVSAWMDARAGVAGAKKKLASIMLINHLIIPFQIYLLELMWSTILGRPPPDEDDPLWAVFLKRSVAGPLSRIFVLGAIAEGLTGLATGDYRRRARISQIPAIETASRVGAAMWEVGEDFFTLNWEDLDESSLELLKSTFVPARQISEGIENRK